ncbi:MAG: hypothetical protein ACK43N_08545, partial [Pirellulaceae bacterium]
ESLLDGPHWKIDRLARKIQLTFAPRFACRFFCSSCFSVVSDLVAKFKRRNQIHSNSGKERLFTNRSPGQFLDLQSLATLFATGKNQQAFLHALELQGVQGVFRC